MFKIIIKFLITLSLFSLPLFSFANENIRITNENTGRNANNEYLGEMEGNEFFYVGTTGEKGIKNLLLNIARDLRVIVFAIVLLVGLILVIKLIFGENTDEEQKKLKMGILWASIGIMVMQIAFSVYKILFDRDIGAPLGRNLSEKLIEPFTDMLMLFASFIFIAMGIYAFYKIVTAGGEEDKVSKGKTTIVQAIIGFIVIKFADIIVTNTFNPDCGGGGILSYYGTNICENITDNAKIVTTLLNWMNSFLAIIIVLMIMYAGFLVLTSGGDSDKHDKAKKILLYVGIGLLILFTSYLILTFFIVPEAQI
ncbi:MAG: hypothetical protein AB7E37_01855 [Candidatus Altimarinota bacterium]